MTTLASLNKFIRIELPGIPELVLNDAVLRATQDFFSRSESWRHSLAAPLLDWTIALVFPAMVEGVELPADTRIVRNDVVKYSSDGTNLKTVPFSTRQQLDSEFPNWEVKTGNSPERWTNDPTPDMPRIIPIATDDHLASLQVRVILAPNDAATTIPDFLYTEFQDDLVNGTLARLMKIPGKDWTNLRSAAAYAAAFEGGIQKAMSRANAEYGQPNNREASYGGIPTYTGRPYGRRGDYGRRGW